jgi:hypothetical protein
LCFFSTQNFNIDITNSLGETITVQTDANGEWSSIVPVGSTIIDVDNDPDFPGLRHNEFADAQGLHRVDRAIHFYNQAQAFAQTNSLSFNWTLNIINGLSHNTSDSIEYGCDLIFN